MFNPFHKVRNWYRSLAELKQQVSRIVSILARLQDNISKTQKALGRIEERQLKVYSNSFISENEFRVFS